VARDGCQKDERNNAAHDPPALMCESRCSSSDTPTGWGLQALQKAPATSSGGCADHTGTPRRVRGAQTTPDDNRGRRARHDRIRQRRRAYESRRETATAEQEILVTK